MIRNPILRGFNPDPSICRVGDDYYIATSTFEWYPGVQIHHSRDLVNWRLVKRPLDRASQLDMRGNPDSGGVWAPCLSYADGLFWLVYTDVKRLDGNFKDAHNYIVTAPAIDGPWSDPVYVNSSGFDPSLFHDDDGRKWFLNMLWNHVSSGVGGNPKHPSFAGILLQEYDPVAAAPRSARSKNIFAGSAHGLVEGPHLFKRDGWYYLTTAEGGTGYDHAVTMARSREHRRALRAAPGRCTSSPPRTRPTRALQRAGHGQIVETPDGEVYHTHLCSRPLPGLRRSPARPRDRDPEMRSGATTAGCGLDAGRPRARRRGARAGPAARTPSRPTPCDTASTAADACRPTSSGCARPIPSASSTLTGGPALAPDRPRVDRQLVRAGARRPPPAAFLLPRRDPAALRPGHLQQAAGLTTTTTAQVPFPRRHPRTGWAGPHHPLLPRRLAGRPAELSAAPPDPRPRRTVAISPSRSPAPA